MIMKVTIMILMMMMMMVMMIKMIIAVSLSIFKLGPLDLAWKYIWIVCAI